MLFRYNLHYYTQRHSVKEIKSSLLFTILLSFILFSFTGCEDKKDQEPLIAVESTTEVFAQKDQKQEKSEIQKVAKTQTQEETNNKEASVSLTSTDTFTLSDIQNNRHTLTISNQKMAFHDINQAIVIVNFFSTWCSPCRGEIPYLSDLQKKYKKKLFVVGVLVNDKQEDKALKAFITKHHANYFISNSKQNDIFAAKLVKELHLPENFSIPLTVIYKEGNYYTHYEGAVPVEMINHDIKEAIKK